MRVRGLLAGTVGVALALALALVLAGAAGCRHAAAAGATAEATGGADGEGADDADAPGAAAGASPASPALAVRRGDLRPRLLLTGELEAARAQPLMAPRTLNFQLQIRWLAEDGAEVAAGQPVVEFDNASFLSNLEQKRLTAAAAADELARIEGEARTGEADKAIAVEQARTDLEKARIAAAVPAELLPRREFQDRQLKARQAESALAKAADDLEAQRAMAAADAGVQRLALAKARREVEAAETAIRDLTLRAPRAGMMLVGDHPFEGRKLLAGDNVWTGATVATLPDLSSMEVEAALSDVDDGRVAPGMRATCYLDAYPATAYACRVAAVSPVARESGRSALLRAFTVRVELAPSRPGQAGRLRPGMSVRVEVAPPPLRRALLVPRAALDLAAAPPRALLAGGGAAPVRLGACDAAWCVAESGLREGQPLRRAAQGTGR